MKKYISLFTIATAFIMLSCERSEIETDRNLQNSETMKRKIQSKSDSISQENVEPGGDDEPERDKQHWRMIIKS